MKTATATQANIESLPVLWQLELSHYNEKARCALECKRIPHIRQAFCHELLPHRELLVALSTHGQPVATGAALQAGFPMLRAGLRRRFQISAESARNSRGPMLAALDHREREISPGGYLVGAPLTVADLTDTAPFDGAAHPAECPYPRLGDDDLPDSWHEFFDSLADRPGVRWAAQSYRRQRGCPSELTPVAISASRPPRDAVYPVTRRPARER
jgi:hypothetical protein